MSHNILPSTSKPSKKTTAPPTTPSSQRNPEIAITDKTSSNQNAQSSAITMASLQEMMIRMQESIDRNYEALTGNMGAMKEDIKKMDERVERLDGRVERLDEKMEFIHGSLTSNDQKIKKIEEYNERMETRIQYTESRTEYVNKNLEEAIINLELEKSAFFLRFQNVTETKEEDLPQIMIEILATLTNKPPQEMIHQIDEIYRINTSYARKNKLPREIHIRFTKRTIRDEIYNLAKDRAITYKGKDILVLRQIPRRVREKRRAYQFLTAKLNRHKIPFRWLIPEGILVTVIDKKYRITSPDYARDFYEQIIKEIEEQDPKELSEKVKGNLEELSSAQYLLERQRGNQPNQEEYGKEGPTTRAQTEARREKRRDHTK